MQRYFVKGNVSENDAFISVLKRPSPSVEESDARSSGRTIRSSG